MSNGRYRQSTIDTLESRYHPSGTPSVVLTDANYATIRADIAAGNSSRLAAWNAFAGDSWSQINSSPRPYETTIRGGTGQNYGAMTQDMDRTFQLAVRWKISGDTKYADQAVKFLNAYSTTNKAIGGNADRFLASGLYGYGWAAVADIMQSYSGWAATDVQQFKDYLVSVYYPMQHDFLTNHNGAAITNYWANWDLANVEGEMAIGIFTGRSDIYNEAINYLYNGGGNGTLENAFYYLHPGNLMQWQESGRDQGHSVLGMQLFGNIAQMAWNQTGVSHYDFYAYNNYQFLAAAEYIAKYNEGNDVPFAEYDWGTGQSGSRQAQTGVSGASRGTGGVGYQLIYGHYADQLGMATPYTAARITRLGVEANNGGNGDDFGFGNLLYRTTPVSTASLTPTGLTAIAKGVGNVELDWFGVSGATNYNVYRATSASGAYTKIASGITDVLSYTDSNLPPATFYYRVTAVGSSGESLASMVVTGTGSTSPVAQLTFDQTSGTTATDASGNGNTGTLVNGAAWATGKSGNAVSLDGVDDYVSLPSNVAASLSDFTIAMWVNLSSNNTWARLFDFGSGTGRNMYLTPKNGSGVIEFNATSVYNYNKQTVTGTATLATNQWVHVAVTLADTTLTIYVNGVAVASSTSMNLPPRQIGSTSQNWIGRSQYASDPYLKGKVDDLRIYNGALTAAQVAAMAGSKSLPTAPTGFSAAATNATTVQLKWSAASNATSYTIYRLAAGQSGYTTVASGLTILSYSDTTVTTGVHYMYLVAAVNIAGAAVSAESSATPAAPPQVKSFTVNDGNSQRSMVRSVDVVFDQSVTLSASAFQVRNSQTGKDVTFSYSQQSDSVYRLTFAGTAVVGGSLADGEYAITINASAVLSGASVPMATDASYAFNRLFGDADGDGDVDGADSRAFRIALGTSTGQSDYQWWFDYDGDGDVDGADSRAFRLALGSTIN